MNNNPVVDLAKTKPYRCEHKPLIGPVCGNEEFELTFFLRVVSAFLSPSGKSEIVSVQAFRCRKCGRIADLGVLKS